MEGWHRPQSGVDRPRVAPLGGGALDAELVALGVGKDREPRAVGSPVVGEEGGPQAEDLLDGEITVDVGYEVQVDAVLELLRFRDGQEEQSGVAPRRVDEGGFGVVRVVGSSGSSTKPRTAAQKRAKG